MKQELLNNVYQQICLTEGQKDRIWQRIETNAKINPIPKRALLPTRVAVCLGVLLMSGMTVFAASELSLMDRIADAMNLLTQNKEELTDAQKNLYAQYGQELDNEFALDNGTLKLDAFLYDENYLLISFRYIFHSDIEGYDELTAGTDIQQTSLWQPSGKMIGYDEDIDTFIHQPFCIVHDSGQTNDTLDSFFVRNSKIMEDGAISGSILLSTHESKSFEPGEVIQIIRTTTAEETIPLTGEGGKEIPFQNITESYDVLSEFTLGDALEQHALTIDAKNAAALENMGISVDRMEISPISLCYSGKGTHTRALSASISVVLKDGSVVENSPTGGGYSLSDANQNNTRFSFFASNVFAAPVLIEDIAEIHIQDPYSSTDIRIPFQ